MRERLWPLLTVLLLAVAAPQALARLRELILSNGDLQSALGLSRAEFERQWFAFVEQRYGL